MYNKLFAKILDSSIWLESDTTRIVWFTLLAAMDQDGFAELTSIPNLAHRARVSKEAAEEAIRCLEGPDPESSTPDNEGRRIERVPGGWLVLNCKLYQDLVTRAIAREHGRLRVQKHRAKKSGNAPVTVETRKETQSDAETDAHAQPEAHANSHNKERKGKGATRVRTFVPMVKYPSSEEEMYDKLDALGYETDRNRDGNFFNQMDANQWHIGNEPVLNWPETYRARLAHANQSADFGPAPTFSGDADF